MVHPLLNCEVQGPGVLAGGKGGPVVHLSVDATWQGVDLRSPRDENGEVSRNR